MINKGVVISNANNTSEKTIVIMGVARSGTTMIAQVVQDLGVDMSSEEGSVVNERSDVYTLLENNKLVQFDNLVEQQNQKHLIWGWKRPKSIEYVDLFEDRIRNPHYIIPFRDYLSIAVRNNMAIDVDVTQNLVSTHKDRYSRVIEFIQKNKQPMLLFSYEKAVLHPKYFVQKVAEFIGVNEEHRIAKAVKSIDVRSNPYLNIDIILGNLDKVQDGNVHGWAKKNNSNKPLTLKLVINKTFVKNIVANKPRKDLAKIGNHAFCESFEEIGLTVGETYEVMICSQHDNPIKKCPFMYTHTV